MRLPWSWDFSGCLVWFVLLFLLVTVFYFIDSVCFVLFVPYVLLNNSSASSQCHSPFHSFSQSRSLSLTSPCLFFVLTHSSVYHAVTSFGTCQVFCYTVYFMCAPHCLHLWVSLCCLVRLLFWLFFLFFFLLHIKSLSLSLHPWVLTHPDCSLQRLLHLTAASNCTLWSKDLFIHWRNLSCSPS